MKRRDFVKTAAAGFSLASAYRKLFPQKTDSPSTLYWVKNIPDDPFYQANHFHAGIDTLLQSMAQDGLAFYRGSQQSKVGPLGLIAPDDIVLIKVNAQWKFRGCTNSDLVRGLIARILDHPQGFRGEVIIVENGQGRGSLNCDTYAAYGNHEVHANANDESHSFLYLQRQLFDDPRVSTFLLDGISGRFIADDDHVTNGYRRFENVSYPCFTSAAGNRVELKDGIWNGSGHDQNLKLINVPVLKHHDVNGSEITAALKHFYGLVSMADGQVPFRHYDGLGESCGKMVVSVRTPVLNIIDAIWVSYKSITGYPLDATCRVNQLLASQDPVALDYWAAKYILYPINLNFRHHPDFPNIDRWLTAARDTINDRQGILNRGAGIQVGQVTKDENLMRVVTAEASS